MSKIRIIESKAEWVNEFNSIACDIRSILSDEALRIDHIGSTSVEQLAAKDIVDIQITVASIRENSIESKLVGAGYIYKESTINDDFVGLSNNSPELSKKYFREKIGERKAHIHVRENGRMNQIYPLIFRDYLRSDKQARIAYETVKKELALRFPNDSVAYYAIKDPFMDVVYKAAKLWGERSEWKPDEKFV